MKFCTSCGQRLDDGSKFCTKCGAPSETINYDTQTATADIDSAVNSENIKETEVKPEAVKPEAKPEESVSSNNNTASAQSGAQNTSSSNSNSAVGGFGGNFSDNNYTNNNNTGYANPNYAYANGYSASSGSMVENNISASRKALVSPFFIIAAVAFLVMTVTSLLTPLINLGAFDFSSLYELERFFNYFDIEVYDIIKIAETTSFIGVFFNFIFSIPAFCAIIGMFLLMFDRDNQPVPTRGFSLIKVKLIFNLVVTCIIGALIIAFLVLITIMAFAGGYGGSYFYDRYGYSGRSVSAIGGSILILLALLIAITILVLSIIYYALSIKSVTSAKRAITTGIAYPNSISGYVIVIGFIIAALNLFPILSSLDNNFLNIFTLISTVSSAIFHLFTSIAMIQYKASLRTN